MHGHRPYLKLALMFALHAALMYALMYAMVDSWENVYPNRNQLYMALLMAAPMLLMELWLMRSMYPDRTRNAAIMLAGVALIAGSFFAIRGQYAIADEEFLTSMIPHHAGALLMCEKARLEDPEIKELCEGIQAGQAREIDWMSEKLELLRAQRQ
jgi:uncharacterized protein (DUF305 family)